MSHFNRLISQKNRSARSEWVLWYLNGQLNQSTLQVYPPHDVWSIYSSNNVSIEADWWSSHSELLFASWSESTHHFLYEVLSLLGKGGVAEVCHGLKVLNYMVVKKQTSAFLQQNILLLPTKPADECCRGDTGKERELWSHLNSRRQLTQKYIKDGCGGCKVEESSGLAKLLEQHHCSHWAPSGWVHSWCAPQWQHSPSAVSTVWASHTGRPASAGAPAQSAPSHSHSNPGAAQTPSTEMAAPDPPQCTE